MAVINPGNPTGQAMTLHLQLLIRIPEVFHAADIGLQVMTEENVREVAIWAAEKGVVRRNLKDPCCKFLK